MNENTTLEFWLNVRADSHRETLRGMKGCMRSSPLVISSRLDEIYREAWNKRPRNKVSMKAGSGTEVAQTSSLVLYSLCVCELCFYSHCKCGLYRCHSLSLRLCMCISTVGVYLRVLHYLFVTINNLLAPRVGSILPSFTTDWWERAHTHQFHSTPSQLFFSKSSFALHT